MYRLAVAALMVFGAAFSGSVSAGSARDASLPAYRCHASKEGKGLALTDSMRRRLDAAEKLTTVEAIPALEALLEDTRPKSDGESQVASALAWRYLEAKRGVDLRIAARRAIENPYIVGQLADVMWALIAQSHADDGDWREVRSVLQPMAEARCRPLPDATRRLLVAALIRTEAFPDALLQLDQMCMVDTPDQLVWMRSALEVDCRLNGAPACLNRVMRYAGTEPSAALQRMLNTALSQLASDAAGRPLLEQAAAQGLLTADYRIIPQAQPTVTELMPKERIAPNYPFHALRAGQSGFVKLRLIVNADGSVLDAKAIDASPPGVFDTAAVEAAKKGRFYPKLVDGEPQVTVGEYAVHFMMEPRPGPASRAPAAAPASPAADSASAPAARPSASRCR